MTEAQPSSVELYDQVLSLGYSISHRSRHKLLPHRWALYIHPLSFRDGPRLISSALGFFRRIVRSYGFANMDDNGAVQLPHFLNLPTELRLSIYSYISHFLNLPAELRLLIYDYVFQDNLPHELDILRYRDLQPSPAITQINRQLRSETLQLYNSAKSHFGENRRWMFRIDARFCSKTFRESVRQKCLNIPTWASVRYLSLLFEFPCTPIGPRQSIQYNLGINAGMLTCELVSEASPVSRYRTHVLESAVRLAILQLATRRPGGRTPPPRLKQGDAECLDVQSCLWPVFDLFDAIPFFSSLEFWEY